MEFREIQSLAVLAASGGILETSAILHLSPAAIHKHIKNLETELGVRLYEKVGRRLQMTQAAELVMPHLNLILAEYDAVLSSLAEWNGLCKGRVRIGTACSTLSSCVLAPLLKGFCRKYPKIDLLVETGSTAMLLDKIEKRALDLVLVVWPEYMDSRAYTVEKLWPFEMVLVSHSPSKFEHWERQPFILYQKESRMESLVGRYLSEMKIYPRAVMQFDNAEAIKAMVFSGLGVSMLPYYTVRKEVKEGRLFLIRQHGRTLLSNIALISSAGTSHPKSAFVAFANAFEDRRLRLTGRSDTPRTHKSCGLRGKAAAPRTT